MISYLAFRTRQGNFGNGQERRDNLSPLYAPNEFNRQLGINTRHYW